MMLAALLATGLGCGARNLVEDAGGGSGGPAGSSGGDGPAAYDVTLIAEEVISDFSTPVGRINLTGTPPRNGYWYTYNDASTSCAQQPAPTGVYDPGLPPQPSPGPSGGFALHAIWRGCDVWGAGIGAYLNMSAPSDGAAGTPQPYDLSGFGGFSFWAMAAPGSNQPRN